MCVGKLLHRILASRLEKFMIANNIINPELQKGFLSGIPGVLERVLSLNAIIDNAKQRNLPLLTTFIDLRNVFGSVPQKLISDMLHHIHVLAQIQEYVSHTYSKLTAEIHTDNWKSPPFQISRAVFQGDTLSPLLFLLSFNPIITYIDHLPTCGFQMSIQLSDTAGLPPANSHIYVEWNEEDSEEPEGWYHCEVEEYKPDGSATIRYRNGSHESLDLRSVNWSFAQKSAKPFLLAGLEPPQHPLKKTREAAQTLKQAKSNPYSVLGYCDDITMLSSPDAHQAALSDVDRKCTDLGLQVRPVRVIHIRWQEDPTTAPPSISNKEQLATSPLPQQIF